MKTIIKISISLIVVTLLIIGFIWWRQSNMVIPRSITKQANYVIFYPVKNQQAVIQKQSFIYDKSLQEVSFIVNLGGQSITFGEQSSPDSFSDDPNFYPQFIQKLNGYATFSSVNGTVDLTLPSDTKHQTGIMNAKGTLLFVQSTTGNLSENAWKQLFNLLVYTQPG